METRQGRIDAMRRGAMNDAGQGVAATDDVRGAAVEGVGPEVTVRYWAAAREASGVDRDRLRGSEVGAVLDAALERHPELSRILRVATFLLDGQAVTRDAPVSPDSTLEVLPPFAGG